MLRPRGLRTSRSSAGLTGCPWGRGHAFVKWRSNQFCVACLHSLEETNACVVTCCPFNASSKKTNVNYYFAAAGEVFALGNTNIIFSWIALAHSVRFPAWDPGAERRRQAVACRAVAEHSCEEPGLMEVMHGISWRVYRKSCTCWHFRIERETTPTRLLVLAFTWRCTTAA